MAALITLTEASKHHGAQTLLNGLSFSVEERDRIGVIGPNGAGKSTLMRVLAGESELDGGTLLRRKDVRISYAAQTAAFDEQGTVFELALAAAEKHSHYDGDIDRVARGALSRLKLELFDTPARNLSGGQRKRLQLALALCASPDLLILDEPTNHLDISSILELEQMLQRAPFAWIVVSHDRWFLETAAQRILEVSPRYPTGAFVCEGSYGLYLERRDEFLQAESKRLASLENIVRQEQAWLRQGAKARSTKSKHRIDAAGDLMESLALVRSRSTSRAVDISFSSSERKTKRLMELTGVTKRFGERTLVEGLDLTVLSGEALGVLGHNGSGKTTFLKLLNGQLAPDQGTIKPAHGLAIAFFQQFDDSINQKSTLKEVLAEEGDSVIFNGQSIHVASWAQRFRFSFAQLNQPYGSLSGGEKARARIARLMLTKADLLILDEPTNDLDIDTLEILEQSLIDFKGAVILVTHDRFMVNRVCTRFIAFDGQGGWELYADYEQWQRDLAAAKSPVSKSEAIKPAAASAKKKLSYSEQRELSGMEETILNAESAVETLQLQLAEPTVQADGQKLQQLCAELGEAQSKVEALYSRWAELEDKSRGNNS